MSASNEEEMGELLEKTSNLKRLGFSHKQDSRYLYSIPRFLDEYDAKLTERVVVDPKIRHGEPIIKGTRVPVEIVLGSLAGGMDVGEVCEEYDRDREDVLAAIDYAHRRISGEEVEPLEP